MRLNMRLVPGNHSVCLDGDAAISSASNSMNISLAWPDPHSRNISLVCALTAANISMDGASAFPHRWQVWDRR